MNIFILHLIKSELINFNEAFQDKILKIAVRILSFILLVILVVLAVITFVKINKGEHVKLFGIEYNIPRDHPDTVVKTVTLPPNPQTYPSVKLNKRFPGVKTSSKVFPSKTKDTIKSAEPTNSNSGVNSGAVGNNAHVVNGVNAGINGDVYNGIRQRHLTDALLSYILIKIPDKSTSIAFLVAGGKEGVIYGNEIYTALLQRGYNNINASNWMDPNGYDKVEVVKQGEKVQLLIYPASNVQ